MKETYVKNGIKKIIENLKVVIKHEGWDKFIGKPVYGQESIYFKKFNNTGSLLEKYIRDGFKKYPGLIFQKYIDGFDKKSPEIRLYYIGNDYKYSIVTTDDTVRVPKQEKGTEKVDNLKALINKGKQTMKNLPPIKMRGRILPRLLTRVDIACEKHCKKPWIINECEFVPSLYIENVDFIPEPDMGDQVIKIAKIFKRKMK